MHIASFYIAGAAVRLLWSVLAFRKQITAVLHYTDLLTETFLNCCAA